MRLDPCCMLLFLLKRPIMLMLVLCITMMMLSYCLETSFEHGSAYDNYKAPSMNHFEVEHVHGYGEHDNHDVFELARSMQRELGIERVPMINALPPEHDNQHRRMYQNRSVVQTARAFRRVTFSINNKQLCNQSEVFALIFVQSATSHFKQRDLIRRTWGSVKTYRGKQIRLVFFVGLTNDSLLQDSLQKESKTYQDIVQISIMDTYRNLTYKHVTAMRWITDYCPSAKFIAKADDDCLVNIFRLVDFLLERFGRSASTSDYIYCSVFHQIGPVRDKKDKWFVSRQEYADSKYPPYCEGFAYIMSSDLPSKLYAAALQTPFFWIDDVYVTGFLAKKVRAKHQSFHYPYSYVLMNPNYASSKVNKTLFVLAKYYSRQDMWENVWRAVEDHSKIRSKEL